ncbi:hypothetical protein GCM10022279_21060 [Comamonas faecalis]|uniref:Toprim domain-containing protein n=1 Tax=Comamonas faecalis TaxID=1387849 RepID=A0ABP7RGK4_9BURK
MTMNTTHPRHAYEANRARIAALWGQARPIQPGDAADLYLRGQGVAPPAGQAAPWPEALRFHPALDYWDAPPGAPAELCGKHPALLAALSINAPARGAPLAVHTVALQRIYLDSCGALAPVWAPIKLTGKDGPSRCAALRLAPVAGRGASLGVAVGLVPALRMGSACRMPVWAVLNAAALAHVHWPRGVDSLYVFLDADDPNQAAPGAELARKAKACGVQVFTLFTCGHTDQAAPTISRFH